MSDAPQDYENAAPVRDYRVDRDIKRTVTTSQLILLTIVTSMGIISYFGDRFVSQIDGGFKETTSTLIGIREEMTLIRTGSQLNTRDIEDIKVNFDGIKLDVDANTKGFVRLCTKIEDANKDWRCLNNGR